MYWELFNTVSGDSTLFLANVTRNISNNELKTQWIHGSYIISYNEENDQEVLKLRIVNATKDDGNFMFNCAYSSMSAP